MAQGRIIWLYGLSGSGKSTIVEATKERFNKTSIRVSTLDGDELRAGLCADLGFSEADRQESLRRLAEVAKLLARDFAYVFVSAITPKEVFKNNIRKILGGSVTFVFCDTSMAICESRDVKGLYAKARRGEIASFTGVSDSFEIGNFDFSLPTGTKSVEVCVELLMKRVLPL